LGASRRASLPSLRGVLTSPGATSQRPHMPTRSIEVAAPTGSMPAAASSSDKWRVMGRCAIYREFGSAKRPGAAETRADIEPVLASSALSFPTLFGVLAAALTIFCKPSTIWDAGTRGTYSTCCCTYVRGGAARDVRTIRSGIRCNPRGQRAVRSASSTALLWHVQHGQSNSL
jgi:hypothetical protein